MRRIFHYIYVSISRPQRVWDCLKNLCMDLRYSGRYLGTPIQNGSADYRNTTSSEYDVIESLFSKVEVTPSDIIVDVGCGKGRVLNWCLRRLKKNSIIGIEADQAVARKTAESFKKYSNISVIEARIEDKLPEGTIFYLFNPFGMKTMCQFLTLIDEKINNGGFPSARPIILYHNATCIDLLSDSKKWDVEDVGELRQLRSVIIRPNKGY